jgi:heme exporter protein C
LENRIARVGRWLGLLALTSIAVWLWLVAFMAPLEQVQGVVQKIFYVHVACVLPSYLGFVLTAIGGFGYLRTRREGWDQLALAGAEVGVLFCSLILITGPLWAKPVWGHWWVWDLRLTLLLVLWFLYVAYLFLRALAFGSDAARTFASVYGITGTAVIPFVYYAVDMARGRTLHPENPAREGLPSEMVIPLLVGMGAFLLLFGYLTTRRLEVAELERQILEAGGTAEGQG